MKKIKLTWTEVGSSVWVNKRMFYKLLELVKEAYNIEIISHTGTKPKI
jgi:hypothetical protein